MTRYHVLSIAVVMLIPGCRRPAHLPRTSAEAEQLRWLDSADVQSDFRDRVERQHDTRFISVYAFSFAGEFGIDETSETKELTRKRGSRHLEGMTDIITSTEHMRLRRKASDYARQYNILLLAYLRNQPNT